MDRYHENEANPSEINKISKNPKFSISKMRFSGTDPCAIIYSQGKQIGSKLLFELRRKSFRGAECFGFALFHFGGSEEGGGANPDGTKPAKGPPA